MMTQTSPRHRAKIARLRGSVVAALVATGATFTPALAETVSLTSPDGSIALSGDFVGFVDDHYVIDTPLGELRISAERVECDGAACPVFEVGDVDVRFAGSDAIGVGLMPLMLEGFASHSGLAADLSGVRGTAQTLAEFTSDDGFGAQSGRILVMPMPAKDAFAALAANEIDVVMTSRRITPGEAQSLTDAGAGRMIAPEQEHIVAVDNLVVITHPSNPVTEIGLEQLRDVFLGRITNWKTLGGPDLPIRVIDHAGDSDARDAFFDSILDGAPLSSVSAERIATSDEDLAARVSASQGAIGFVPFAFQRGAQPTTLISSCGIAMQPDAFFAKTEEYPLQRRLYLYNRGDLEAGLAHDVIAYARSDAADEVIAKAGFVDLGVERTSRALSASRAKRLEKADVDAFERGVIGEMLTAMDGYDRLSTTFRFRSGSSQLDERALTDMGRLVSYLEQQEPGTRVKLVGFTDDVGAFDSNRRLSERRAAQVLQALRDAAGGRLDALEIETAGFGEIAPASCNLSDRDRRINRRVEIWIEKSDQERS